MELIEQINKNFSIVIWLWQESGKTEDKTVAIEFVIINNQVAT